MTDKEDALSTALDQRLDDLFDEGNLDVEEPKPSVSEKSSAPKDKPQNSRPNNFKATESQQPGGEVMRGLNALLLSMEWEIDDSVMSKYLAEIQRLQELHKDDMFFINFTKMLESIGLYLKRHKVHAHQDTLKILQEIQAGLGLLVDMQDSLSDKEKKIYFNQTYERFQVFRKQITGKSADVTKASLNKNTELVTLIRGIVRKELAMLRKELLEELRSAQPKQP
ncbi:hypothetical protein LZ24_00945 [Desulfobotulus alkaliphilus]|uniref:Uncharacterized protein n=1 Tax=Desulfobotulus alkaliphilus TaxID=622671 RepID=A0A562RZ04_9BACT|nr:hypothetical protein [Desulfobotulus alkaliphilus]TWI74342.1 hypothetical protein LZ24_00945 [Desulfobotulus alkaliphilus]